MARGHPLVLSVSDNECLESGVPGPWGRVDPGQHSCPLVGLFAQVQRVTGTDARTRDLRPPRLPPIWEVCCILRGLGDSFELGTFGFCCL